MAKSRHPIFGLVHRANVLRYADADDGYGGVTQGVVTTIYSNRKCRITLMTDEDEQKGFGNVSGKKWDVILEYSPNIVTSDFLQVSWGAPCNVTPPVDGTLPYYGRVMTPDNIKTLTSDGNSPPTYADATGDYTVTWGGAAWSFEDADEVHTIALAGAATDNPFTLSWPDAGDSDGYWLRDYGWGPKLFRVLWVKHQIDEFGSNHHTSVKMELEDNA